MIYDAPCSLPGASFAHLPIYGLDDLGFVPRGEAGAFIAGHNTAPGVPAQHQWRRSFVHAFRHVRMSALQEGVRQMRGTAPARIPDARISVCHGVGGMFAASGTIIMSNEGPYRRSGVPLIEQAHREGQIVRCATLEGEKRYTCGDMARLTNRFAMLAHNHPASGRCRLML
jgi:hypothetical protein